MGLSAAVGYFPLPLLSFLILSPLSSTPTLSFISHFVLLNPSFSVICILFSAAFCVLLRFTGQTDRVTGGRRHRQTDSVEAALLLAH